MPSRNSINKPKDKLQRNSHASSIGKKRSARARNGIVTKSSTPRYETDSNAAPKATESKAIALYNGATTPTGVIINNTLSNKRSKKIARNKKYIAKRNEKLNIDLLADQEQMEVDEETEKEEQTKAKNQTKLDKIKEVLWAAVEDRVSEGLKVSSGTDGSGTTLGVQAF